jgi:hypothetical protein
MTEEDISRIKKSLYRILRNRAHHPDRAFHDFQTETMLSLLIHLQGESREFLIEDRHV